MARLRRLWPGSLWVVSVIAVIIGTCLLVRASVGPDEQETILSAVLASFIAILALGAIVVTLLWPQYNDAIDRMQNLIKPFAQIIFETQADRIRILEFFPIALMRLENAHSDEIKQIWRKRYKNVDSVVLELVRYIYSLSWYETPIPITYFKVVLESSIKFHHLVSQLDVEVTMKSIAIRLQPEVLLQMQFDLFNPTNYFFHEVDGGFPTDLSSTLYYKTLIGGYVRLRSKVLSYLALASRKAYAIYVLIVVELVGLICGLQKWVADHIWLSKTLEILFLCLATFIIVVLIKLLLPIRDRNGGLL